MKELKGIKIDVVNKTIDVCLLKHGGSLHELYDVCNCKCVEIVNRMFNNIPCSIICDEEALLKDTIPPVAVITKTSAGNTVEKILGNCFICKYSDTADFKSLTDDEINSILKHCKKDGVLHGKV